MTISFGLRNVADTGAALAEMLRVTKPGGRLVVCEFGHLPGRRLNALYERYLSAVLPAVARRLSRNPDAYELPGRVDQGLAGQAGAGAADGRRGLVGSTLAKPDHGRRHCACRAPSSVTAA